MRFGPTVGRCEKRQNALDVLVLPRPHAVREVKDRSAALRGSQRTATPQYGAGIHRQDARNAFKQGGLSGAIGADQPEHLTGMHAKANVGECDLVAIVLGQSTDFERDLPWLGWDD